jgi:archaellum component FlaC
MSSFVYDASIDNPENSNSTEKSIKIVVFFDGTCNNRANVRVREEYEKNKAKNKKKEDLSDEEKSYRSHGGDTSYESDHSNIDKLENAMISSEGTIEKIYIEGIGTDDFEGDDTLDGTAYGRKSNGIRGKVKDACMRIAKKIDDTITSVTFDVFGFSRGAAAARNFVYEVSRKDGIIKLAEDEKVDSQNYKSENGIPKSGFLGYFLKWRIVVWWYKHCSYMYKSMVEN